METIHPFFYFLAGFIIATIVPYRIIMKMQEEILVLRGFIDKVDAFAKQVLENHQKKSEEKQGELKA